MTDRTDRIWSSQLIAADIYDCYSLKAAEKNGYHAAYLSMDAVAECVCGLKGAGLMSSEEFLWAAKRIASFSGIPVIAEIRSGFGFSAESAARTAGRLAKAGIHAVWLDDSVFQDPERRVFGEAWEERVRSVKAELKDFPCRLICTVHADRMTMEEAAEKCRQASEQGADLTGVSGLNGIEEARRLAELVRTPKIWIGAECGGIRAEELEELGYSLILDCHSAEGALEGMRLFGERTQTDRHTVFHDQHDFDGMLPSRSHYDLFEFYKTWIPLEQSFLDAASGNGKTTE